MKYWILAAIFASSAASMGATPVLPSAVIAENHYVVPGNAELASQSTFTVDGLQWQVAGNDVQLIYHTPKDLVAGREVVMDLRGALSDANQPFTRLTGSNGDASCVVMEKRVTCLIIYGQAKIFGQDIDVAKQEGALYLRDKYEGDLNLDKRVAVSGLFANEPGGVLDFQPEDVSGQ